MILYNKKKQYGCPFFSSHRYSIKDDDDDDDNSK